MLRQALENRHFNSLEELQAIVEQHAQQRHQRELDEFHGLSREQMHRLLNFPFTSPELVHFAGFLGLAEVEPITDERFCHQHRVRALPLLGETVTFQLTG